MSLAHSPKKLCAFFVPFDGVDGPWFSLSTRPRIVAEQIAGGAQNKGIRNLHMVNLKFASIFCKSRKKNPLKKICLFVIWKKNRSASASSKWFEAVTVGKFPPFLLYEKDWICYQKTTSRMCSAMLEDQCGIKSLSLTTAGKTFHNLSFSFFSFFNSWFDFVFSSHDFVDIKAKLSSTRRAWKRCFLQSKSWDKVRQLLSLHCKPNFGSFSAPFRYIILQLPEHSSNFSFSLIFLIMLGEFLIWLRRC